MPHETPEFDNHAPDAKRVRKSSGAETGDLLFAILTHDTISALNLIKFGDVDFGCVSGTGQNLLMIAIKEQLSDIAIALLATGLINPTAVDINDNT